MLGIKLVFDGSRRLPKFVKISNEEGLILAKYKAPNPSDEGLETLSKTIPVNNSFYAR